MIAPRTRSPCARMRAPYPKQIVSSSRRSAVKLHDSVEVVLRHKGSQVYSIFPDVTVYKALEVMADKDIGELVVINGAEVVGVMSERDYVRKVILKGFSSKEITVEDIMST